MQREWDLRRETTIEEALKDARKEICGPNRNILALDRRYLSAEIVHPDDEG